MVVMLDNLVLSINKLKKDGFVSSKQTGKTKTRVWLKHIPKEINIDMKDYNPLEYWKNVFKGVKGAKQKKAVLEPLKKLFTDDKIINKIKGYKGYALWGCMCLNNYTCVQVYIDKIKYSLENECLLPQYSIIDPQLAFNLSKRIIASTGMDALCQAIESYWSVNSNKKSKKYSEEAINLIINNLPLAVNKLNKKFDIDKSEKIFKNVKKKSAKT